MSTFISLILGCVAWIIPIRAVTPKKIHGGYTYILTSLGACTISLQVQVFRVVFRISGGETENIDKLFEVITLGCGIMIVGTFIINIWAFFKKKSWNKQNKSQTINKNTKNQFNKNKKKR